jgi:uncharacterized membrane protein YoaK (UPF0700 family)
LTRSPPRHPQSVSNSRLPTPPEDALPGHAFFVVLALASGATDAFGYLKLGGTFTSVMTGNMVLFAAAAAKGNGGLVVRTSLAICGYLAGAVLAVRISGPTYSATPGRTVKRLLCVELAIFIAYGAVFQIAGLSTHLGVQAAVLGVAAIALGMQSSAVQSYQVSGLSTTFLTGTLTSVAINLAAGRSLRHSARSLLILGGLLVGAGSASALSLASPRAAAFLPALFVAVALNVPRGPTAVAVELPSVAQDAATESAV